MKKVLVMGGTRFFGKYLVWNLLERGHQVTIATRGQTLDEFGEQVTRIIFDRQDPESIKAAFAGQDFDVIYDNIAYTSMDIVNFLENVTVKRYIVTSSMAVYPRLHGDLKENDFVANRPYELVTSEQVNYAEGKRSLERVIVQKYLNDAVMVRFPYVVGIDDYTERLKNYVVRTLNQEAQAIDNLDAQMAFVNAQEAGAFLAFLSQVNFTGAINGASSGTVSLAEILRYVEKQTGQAPIISTEGVPGAYNHTPEYSLNNDRAQQLGFTFSELKDWLYPLLDHEIDRWRQG